MDEELNTTGIEPLRNRVLVRLIESPDVSKGGIIIPEMAKDPPQKGVVLEIGPGVDWSDGSHSPVNEKIKPGVKVLFGKYHGTHLKVENVKYAILLEEDLLAILHNDSDE